LSSRGLRKHLGFSQYVLTKQETRPPKIKRYATKTSRMQPNITRYPKKQESGQFTEKKIKQKGLGSVLKW
jgi:hypothetical protein